MTRRALAALAVPAFLFLSHAVLGAPARTLDPTLSLRAAMDPIVLSSRVVGHGELPRSAKVAFRLRVATSLTHPPIVTRERTIVLAHADPMLAEYDGRGRLLWAARLGASPAATGPFVFADGTRAVVTEGGELIGFSARGRAVRRERLPLGALGPGLLLEGTTDGGLLLSQGQRLIRLDALGTVVSDTRLKFELRALLTGVALASPSVAPLTPLLVSAGGSVLELAWDGRASFRARFSGAVSDAVRLDARRVLAVLDERRLVELDITEGTESTRLEAPDLELSSLLAVNRSGEVRVLSSGDLLLAFDARGAERFRVPLAPPGASSSAKGASELLLDRAGTALVVGGGFGTVTVGADGQSTRLEGASCPEPLRPAWFSFASVLIACRSGVLLKLDRSGS